MIKPISIEGISPVRVIDYLRKRYGGKWRFRGQGGWEHIGKGFVRRVAIFGGWNGDDVCGSELIYYPKDGRPERVFYD